MASRVELCDPGYYCIGGMQIPCPVGVYGESQGLAASTCTDRCLAGEYCPAGSPRPTICNKGYYCPDGAIQVICPAGVYGAIAGLRDRRCSGLCRPGYYCEAGSISATSKFAQQDDMVVVPPDLVAVLAQGPARQVTTALLVR